MKKFLALLLCLLMIVTCFAACGEGDKETTTDNNQSTGGQTTELEIPWNPDWGEWEGTQNN